MEIVKFRALEEDEIQELEKEKLKALDILNLSIDTDSKTILEKMDEIVDNPAGLDLEAVGLSFGCLYGSLFVKDYGWSWYNILYDNEIDYYMIASKDQREAKQPLNYFFSILKGEHQNNFILG